MKWKKLGVVWKPDGDRSWAKSHAMVPTPLRVSPDLIRIYITCLDEEGRGRPGFVEVDARDPTQIVDVSIDPLLDIGSPGCFDDNGVMATSVLETAPNQFYMYYAGYEICKNIRYRILTGLAISRDGGKTFHRYSEAPVLERSDEEKFFRGGPCVLFDRKKFKLWYVAGSSWTSINNKLMPVYDLRYQASEDGIHWQPKGRLSLEISDPDEHGFGRPWIVKRGEGDYQLFYSIRKRSCAAYRLGYAVSKDGISWERLDSHMGLDVSSDDTTANAIMYSSVITIDNNTYCFYNGDNFGEHGFCAAVLEAF